MAMHAMLMGTLIKDPTSRTSSSGTPYTTATLRVPCEGADAFLASAIAFNSAAAEALAQHKRGDTVVVGGRASLKSWNGRDGTEQHGLGIVVEAVMSEYQFAKRRKQSGNSVE